MGSQDEDSLWQEPCGQGHLRSSTSNNIAGSSSLMMKYCLVRMCNNTNSGKSDPYLRVSQDSVPLHTTATVGFTPNVFPQDYHEIGFCHYSPDQLTFKCIISFALQLFTTERVSHLENEIKTFLSSML